MYSRKRDISAILIGIAFGAVISWPLTPVMLLSVILLCAVSFVLVVVP